MREVSGWTRPSHSVRVLRLLSRRMRLAKVRAGAGAVSGRESRLVSLIFKPYFASISSLADSAAKSIADVVFLPMYFRRSISRRRSMCVDVLSVGVHFADLRTSITCLWLDGLIRSDEQRQKGPPLNSD